MRSSHGLGALLIVVACGGEPGTVTPTPVVASISITPSPIPQACEGAEIQLGAIAKDASGVVIPGVTIAWSSDQPAIATVNGSGRVAAVASGLVHIRASTGSVFVEVELPVRGTGMGIAYKYPSLFLGDTTQLSSVANDGLGPLTPLQWQSDDPAIASVDPSGIVHGIVPGLVKVTVQGLCGSTASVMVAVLRARTGVNRSIAYVADVASGSFFVDRVRLVSPTGVLLRNITAPPDWAQSFAWSPDGRGILAVTFMSNNGGRAGNWVVDPDLGGELSLPLPTMIAAEYSPDGQSIAYSEIRGADVSEIHVLKVDGSSRMQLTTAPGDDVEPQWSPDGRQLLYMHYVDFYLPAEAWVVAADGTDRRKLVLPVDALHVRWSPDGKYISFSNIWGAWLVNADGTGVRPLTSNCNVSGACAQTQSNQYPTWAPDGRKMAWVHFSLGQGYLLVRDFPGPGEFLIPVTGTCCWPIFPEWSPDGRELAFAGRRPGVLPWPSIGVVGIDGAGFRWITDGENAHTPKWRP